MIKKNKNQVKIEFGNNDIVMKTKTVNSFKTGIIGFLENSPNADYSKYLTDNGEADAAKYPVVMSFSNTKSIDNLIKRLNVLKENMKKNNTTILLVFPGIENENMLIFDSPAHILLLLSIEKNDNNEINYVYDKVNLNDEFIDYIKEYDKNGIILIPCYNEIRKFLQENDIKYKILYPDINSNEIKDRVLKNIKNPYYCKKAGEMIENYDDSIKKLKEDNFGEKIELKDNESIENIIYKYI